MAFDFTKTIPQVLLNGSVSGSITIGPDAISAAPFFAVILGIDVYADVQPNNGDCDILAIAPGPGVAPITLMKIQQSQNFPGPFYWRGFLGLQPSYKVQVTATVPFEVSIWGLIAPNFGM